MNSAWPLVTAGLLMGAGGSLHCLAMCAGLQRMTLRGIPVVTLRGAAARSGAEQPASAARPAFAGAPAPVGHGTPAATPAAPATLPGRHSGAAGPARPDGVSSTALSLPRAAIAENPGLTPASLTASTGGTASLRWNRSLQLPDGRWWRFQLGRLAGYGLLGLVAGWVGQEVLAAARWQPLFESIWAGLNALLVMLGLSLLVLGREPAALARAGSWLASRAPLSAGSRTEWLRGMLWALLPCGLLYTAVATAVLAATPLGAAAVMAAFALGTNLGLFLMEAGLHSLLAGMRPQLAYRVNGLLLVALATSGLVAALGGMEHPFC